MEKRVVNEHDEKFYDEWVAAHEARRLELLDAVAVDWQERMAAAGYRIAPDTRNERNGL